MLSRIRVKNWVFVYHLSVENGGLEKEKPEKVTESGKMSHSLPEFFKGTSPPDKRD